MNSTESLNPNKLNIDQIIQKNDDFGRWTIVKEGTPKRVKGITFKNYTKRQAIKKVENDNKVN